MNRSPSIAAGSLLVTVLLASPPPASANFKRQHASSCIEDNAEHQAMFQDQFLINAGSAGLEQFVCGLPEDTNLRKDKVVRLNVTGVDQSTTGQVYARACVGFSGGIGVQCDPSVTNGALSVTGPFTLTVPHACWNSSHSLDYAYTQVGIPPLQQSYSGLSGVFYADING